MDSASSDALKKTQDLLRDHSKRMNAVNGSQKGKDAHKQVQQLFGSSGNVDKAYEMAAQMMGSVMKEAGGDATKAQEILNTGAANPAAFAERLPSDFKKMLHETANDIEKSKGPKRH
ncbi:MAG: hypothetical protein ACRBBP_04835 [Bdellovibrionales bacterium]